MIIELNNNTKKADALVYKYHRSHITDIYQAYTKPSQAKVNMFEYLKEMAEQDGGSTPYILSYNTYQFTVGYMIYMNNKYWLKVITKENIYLIKI